MTRAGAAAARSSSSAMAPPEGGSAAATPRDFAAELASAETRLAEAERYLGLERLEARRAELEVQAAKPDLWDDADAGGPSPPSWARSWPTSKA